MNKAILVMTYGTPEEYTFEGIAKFFTNIRKGVRPNDEEINLLLKNYLRIDGSPLQEITLKEVELLRESVEDEYKVYFANKFSSPYIPNIISKMEDDGIEECICLILEPHYSFYSIMGYERFIKSDKIKFNIIKSWYKEEKLIEFWADEIKKIITEKVKEDSYKVVFSAHSVPEIALKYNDPYVEQIFDMTKLIAEKIGLENENYTNTWQSESDIGMPWIKPDVLEYLREQKEHPKHYIFVPLSFISEHIEVLFDNDVECRELCEEFGITYHRPPMPNYDSRLIDALVSTIEANKNWLSARRAIMRNPVDRIGYGGYLSLAYKFPKFVDYIEHVTDEFREIYDIVKHTKPYTGLKVAILNAWGRLRTWQAHMVAHELPYKQIYSYLGIMEALSGASVDVSFISFDDIIKDGVPEGVDVIINAGDAGTSFSGGEVWKNETLITRIREFVYNGGGFVGVGEPTAVHHQGRFFQLGDILGVEREMGYSLSTDKYFTKELKEHFIIEDIEDVHKIDFGENIKNVYGLTSATEVLEFSNPKVSAGGVEEGIVLPANAEGKEFGEIHLAANPYGKGRGVYIAGLPYTPENTRLLMRALFYAANKESELTKWYASNPLVEVHAYPEKGVYAIVNNTNEAQTTLVYDGEGVSRTVELEPSEIRWEKIS